MAIQQRNAANVSLLSNDLVQNQGELHLSCVHVNATPYAANKNSVMYCTTGAGNIVLNLPVAALNYGKVYAIKKIDAGAGSVVVTPNVGAGDLIDGAINYPVAAQWDSIIIVSDGTTRWWIISLA